MMYQNKRNNRIAAVVEENSKFNTVLLQFEDDKSTTSITTSTLKRWWRKIEAPEVVEPVIDLNNPITEEEAQKLGRIDGEKALELEEDEVAGDGTPYKEVMQEILQDEKVAKSRKDSKKKVKADKKERRRREPEAYAIEAVEYVYDVVKSFGDEIFVPATDIKMRSFKVGGHMYCKFNYSNSSITIAVRGLSIPKKFTSPNKVVNHLFDSQYQFTSALTDTDKQLIADILRNARDYRISQNNKNN